MDATAELAHRPSPAGAEASEAHRPRLDCLGLARLEVFGQWIDLSGSLDSPPVDLLLRVAAAGPSGARAAALEAALWPGLAPRSQRARLNECLRALAVLVANGAAPVVLSGERLHIDRSRLRVDALELEAAISPLLLPYSRERGEATRNARAALAGALATNAAFLPGIAAPWAVAARLRIADALARAARQLACC